MSHIVSAQVGIGTTDPKSTLEVVGNPSNTTSKDGLIPPKLQRSQLIAKTGYGTDQTGAVVYVTDISGVTNTETIKVTTPGYYYWDGDSWEPIGNSGDGRNIYNENGSLSSDRVVSQGTRTLAFNSTATSGTSHFNIDSGTFNVDANNNRIGIGNTAPNLSFDVTTTSGIGLKTSNATQWDHLMLNAGPTSSTISAGGAENGLQFRVGSGASGSYGGQSYTTVATMMPSGNVGIGNTSPNAPLQFGNSIANRKIVLWEGFNNDHQFYGFGINNNILRYQVNSLNDSHVFYAAANSSTASNELMRIQGNGNVGIGTNNPQRKLEINSVSLATPPLRLTQQTANANATNTSGNSNLLVVDSLGDVKTMLHNKGYSPNDCSCTGTLPYTLPANFTFFGQYDGNWSGNGAGNTTNADLILPTVANSLAAGHKYGSIVVVYRGSTFNTVVGTTNTDLPSNYLIANGESLIFVLTPSKWKRINLY